MNPLRWGIWVGPTLDRERDRKRSLPGAYVLLFKLDCEATILTGRLGLTSYPAGWYAYVGSALGSLRGRIGHHLRSHKRPYWHIDYVLPHGTLSAIVATQTSQRLECRLAAFLARRFPVVRRFGSSDCRCRGHLFRCEAWEPLVDSVLEAMGAACCRSCSLYTQRQFLTHMAAKEPCPIKSARSDANASLELCKCIITGYPTVLYLKPDLRRQARRRWGNPLLS